MDRINKYEGFEVETTNNESSKEESYIDYIDAVEDLKQNLVKASKVSTASSVINNTTQTDDLYVATEYVKINLQMLGININTVDPGFEGVLDTSINAIKNFFKTIINTIGELLKAIYKFLDKLINTIISWFKKDKKTVKEEVEESYEKAKKKAEKEHKNIDEELDRIVENDEDYDLLDRIKNETLMRMPMVLYMAGHIDSYNVIDVMRALLEVFYKLENLQIPEALDMIFPMDTHMFIFKNKIMENINTVVLSKDYEVLANEVDVIKKLYRDDLKELHKLPLLFDVKYDSDYLIKVYKDILTYEDIKDTDNNKIIITSIGPNEISYLRLTIKPDFEKCYKDMMEILKRSTKADERAFDELLEVFNSIYKTYLNISIMPGRLTKDIVESLGYKFKDMLDESDIVTRGQLEKVIKALATYDAVTEKFKIGIYREKELKNKINKFMRSFKTMNEVMKQFLNNSDNPDMKRLGKVWFKYSELILHTLQMMSNTVHSISKYYRDFIFNKKGMSLFIRILSDYYTKMPVR